MLIQCIIMVSYWEGGTEWIHSFEERLDIMTSEYTNALWHLVSKRVKHRYPHLSKGARYWLTRRYFVAISKSVKDAEDSQREIDDLIEAEVLRQLVK